MPNHKGFEQQQPASAVLPSSSRGASEQVQQLNSMSNNEGPNSSFLFGTYGGQQDNKVVGTVAIEKAIDQSLTRTTKTQTKDKPVVKEREGGGKFSVLQKWLRGDDKSNADKKSSPGRSLKFNNYFII